MWTTSASSDFFGAGGYPEGASAGPECQCFIEVETAFTEDFVDLILAAPFDEDGSGGSDHSRAPARLGYRFEPEDAGEHKATTLWGPDWGYHPAGWEDMGDYERIIHELDLPRKDTGRDHWGEVYNVDGFATYAGTWDIRATLQARDGSYVASCADYPDLWLALGRAPRATLTTPPPMYSSSSGTEGSGKCVAGSTRTTRFQLVQFPGHPRPALLAVGGAHQYLHSAIQQVTVVQWNNASVLELSNGASKALLTPASPSVSLGTTPWALGTELWKAGRAERDGQIWQWPVVDITHQCPAAPPPQQSAPGVGYGVSLHQLDQLVNAATGGLGLGTFVTEAPNPFMPTYALRVLPEESPLGAWHTHSLRLELRGSHAQLRLPLHQLSANQWQLQITSSAVQVSGLVTRSGNTLTIQVGPGQILSTATAPVQLTTQELLGQ